jgi:hypothetical protein
MAGLEPEAPSYGRRSGVPAPEIADTIEAMFSYFHDTKREYPALVEAIDKEASAWRGEVEWLHHADQATLDQFFGQPSRMDVEAALAARGVTKENTAPDGYQEQAQMLFQTLETNSGAYWPGEVVPTLDDYRELLRFDAYRERLHGIEDGPATKLIRRLDAFEGAFGAKHLAITGLSHEIDSYVNGTRRHPAEVYAEPAEVHVDYLNAFQHTYTPSISWTPSDDMSTVTATVRRGSGLAEGKFTFLAEEKAKFEAALLRGEITARIVAVPGRCYGDDSIRVTMSMDDYTRRFLAILRGEIPVDTCYRSEFGMQTAPIGQVEIFRGYEPGKAAFFDGGDVLVDIEFMRYLSGGRSRRPSTPASKGLRFLREASAVRETAEFVTTAPGLKSEFVRLSSVLPKRSDDVHFIDGVYYSSTDLHNKINRSLEDIQGAASGQSPNAWHLRLAQTQPAHDDASFSHSGDMYVAQGERGYQLALHIQHKYGATYTWAITDPRAKAKADGQRMFVIRTSTLPIAAQREAKAEIRSVLGGAAVRAPQAVALQAG